MAMVLTPFPMIDNPIQKTRPLSQLVSPPPADQPDTTRRTGQLWPRGETTIVNVTKSSADGGTP